MVSSEREAVGRIRATFEHVIRQGAKRSAMVGATDDEITQYGSQQGVRSVPAAVNEVLRLIGVESGLWFRGTSFGVGAFDLDYKAYVIALLSQLKHGLRDPEGMLILTAHQGYNFQVVDGADLHLPDPPVWDIVDCESASMEWPSISSWFEAHAPWIEDIRDWLQDMEEMGHQSSWADYIDPL